MGLTRGTPPALLAALAGHFNPVLLTYADWPGEEIRTHTGAGDLSWDGETWLGAGNLVRFQAPNESGGLATDDGSVQVAATVADILAERGKVIRNRAINVWFGATTEPGGNVLVADPVLFFTGYFDSRTNSLARAGEHLSHDMTLGLGIGPGARSAASITHGYEDQITEFPGDTAGRQVQIAIRRQFNPQSWPET
jgi:hypothetical protein